MRKDNRTNMMDFITKNYIRIALATPIVTALALAALSSGGCDTSTTGVPAKGFTQIDKLARPAIAEGLILSDTAFVAWNAATPSAETGTTAAMNEIVKTLSAIHAGIGLPGVISVAPPAGAVAVTNAQRIDSISRAFIPDVMRINTAAASGYATGAISFESITAPAIGVLRPVGGRKLEDDAIDITLLVLTSLNGGVTPGSGPFSSDSVPYRVLSAANGTQKDTTAGIGHNLLHRQSSTGADASFPFLAVPN